MIKRTPLEIEANEIDLQLFNLINRIKQSGIEHDVHEWGFVAEGLRNERWSIRNCMSKTDYEATKG